MPKAQNTSLKLTPIEKEVVVLKATLDLINEMVNHTLFVLLGENPDTNILFHTENDQRLFSIILVDFLSETDERIIGPRKTYLEFLSEILKTPSFGKKGSEKLLISAIEKFSTWLNTEVTFKKVWFPSINQEVSLTLKRREFLKICGNISKHNFSRLSSERNKICKILNNSGVKATPEKALLAMNDFQEHFYEGILGYHASTLAEFLNEIRWGIQDYLTEENLSHRNKTKKIANGGKYIFPSHIKNELAKFCYFELMHHLNIGPYFRRFKVNKYLKLRY